MAVALVFVGRVRQVTVLWALYTPGWSRQRQSSLCQCASVQTTGSEIWRVVTELLSAFRYKKSLSGVNDVDRDKSEIECERKLVLLWRFDRRKEEEDEEEEGEDAFFSCFLIFNKSNKRF